MTNRLCVSTASLALALASALLTPAVAADLSIAPIYKAPPAAPAATWSGSYLGISGGGAWGNAVVRNDLTGADQTPRMNLNGGIVGLTSGFNIQRGPVVFGLEGDISATNEKGSAVEFPPNAVFHNEVKERWLSTFRGRVGYAQDNWLLYATGGGALANLRQIGSVAVGEISNSSGIGAGPPAQVSRSSSPRTGRRRWNISTSGCRTSRISIRHPVWRFRAASA